MRGAPRDACAASNRLLIIRFCPPSLKQSISGVVFLRWCLLAVSEMSAALLQHKNKQGPTGPLEKMMVTSGSVSMNLDLGRLNGVDSAMRKAGALHFTVQPNSFFTILVFNNLLRAAEPGSMQLIGQGTASLPARLSASLGQLVLEKTPRDVSGDMIVRDGKTGFVFFNVDGNQYDYDANAQLLTVTGGTLLILKEFANVLQRLSDAGS